MKITVKKDKENLASIKVVTDPGRGKEEYKKTARKFADYVNIPGFRKGKAPIKMIEQQVGVDQIKAETMNTLLAEILYEAFEKEDLEVIAIPVIEKSDFPGPDEAITIEAKIELVPDIKLGDYKGLDAEVQVPMFNEKEYLNETLEKISKQLTTFEESDGAIEMGDEVTFDFAGKIKKTGEEMDSMKAEGFQTIIEPGRFVGDFLEQMVGMKANDEKELEVTFPDEYHEPKLKGEVTLFKVKVIKVSKPQAPKIDDELAQKVGNKDLAELKTRVIDEMTKIDENNKKSATNDVLTHMIMEKTEVDIPSSMVDREIESMQNQYKQSVERSGLKWEDVKDNFKMDEAKQSAEDRILRSLVISAIIKAEDLKVEDKELQDKFNEVASQIPPEQIQNLLNDPGFNNNIRLEVLSDKAMDIVRKESKVKYIELKEGEEPKKATKKSTAKKPAAKKKTTKKKEASKAKK